jgi:hypothetical protein
MAQRKFFKEYDYGSVFIYDSRGDYTTFKRKKIIWTVLTIITGVPLGILLYLKFLKDALGKEIEISQTLLVVLLIGFSVLFLVALISLGVVFQSDSDRVEVNISTKVCKLRNKKKIPFSNIKKIILYSIM